VLAQNGGFQNKYAKKCSCSTTALLQIMIDTKRLRYFILSDQNKLVAFSSSTEHRVLARVLQWLAIGDFHHIMFSTNALLYASSLCLQ
jgi:hypothetical protein